jgi:hypothetical protein
MTGGDGRPGTQLEKLRELIHNRQKLAPVKRGRWTFFMEAVGTSKRPKN